GAPHPNPLPGGRGDVKLSPLRRRRRGRGHSVYITAPHSLRTRRRGGWPTLRVGFFDFQDIGPRGDLEQVIEQLEVFRPFPSTSGEFHKRGLLTIAENRRHPKNVVRLARFFVVCPNLLFVLAGA